MRLNKKNKYWVSSILSFISLVFFNSNVNAQTNVTFFNQSHTLFQSEEQYQQKLYPAAILSTRQYTLPNIARFLNTDPIIDEDRTLFTKIISQIDNGDDIEDSNILFVDANYNQRVALAKARQYFKSKQWQQTIKYYELAGYANLNNKDIIKAKFQLAYSYFNNNQFSESKKIFNILKDLDSNVYTLPTRYYYGLLSYNELNYNDALIAFQKIENEDKYKEVVPFYIAEILYFKGDKKESLQKAKAITVQNKSNYYNAETHLLIAQCLYEQGDKYKEALPYFEYYYNKVDKIRKQDLYKMGYCYYYTKQWNKAIDVLEQLNSIQDALGQNALYILGDCYLKVYNKKNAKNAFTICSQMPYENDLIAPSLLMSGKLAIELGYVNEGLRQLEKLQDPKFLATSYQIEAASILSEQMLYSGNYEGAYNLIKDNANNNNEVRQKVIFAYAMYLWQKGQLSKVESLLNETIQIGLNNSFLAAAYFWKAELNYKNENYNEALISDKQFIKNYTDEVLKVSSPATLSHAYLTMGYVSLQLQNYADAKTYFAQSRNSLTQSSTYATTTASDAMLREADAAFLNKEYSNALELYNKVITLKNEDFDYARFQKTNLLGLLDKDKEQLDLLTSIISQTNPISKYRYEAYFSKGDLLLDVDKYEDAIACFNKITLQDAKHLYAKAQLKLAYAYQELNNENKSIEIFENVLKQYKNSDESHLALESLKNIYIKANKPNDFVQLLNKYEITDTTSEKLENVFYTAAENQYIAKEYNKAIEAFSQYLLKYPNGTNIIKAYYYRASCYNSLSQYNDALQDYNKVLEMPWNNFTESAALSSSNIAMSQKNYIMAQRYYEILRLNAISKNKLVTGYKGLMLATYKLNELERAAQFADTLIAISDIDEDVLNEAQIVKANYLLTHNKQDQAIALFEQLKGSKNIDIAAESEYQCAKNLLYNNKISDAERVTATAIKNTTSSSYWNTKCYLLMTDVFVAQKDYFNAKATLQSIIKNTNIEELKSEAKTKYDQVLILDKKNKLKEG